jgi:hypothetical protein
MIEDDFTITGSQPADKIDFFDNFSLLYPPGESSKFQDITSELTSAAWHDLGIEQVLAAFTGNQDHQKAIREIFARLVRDPQVIRYRQDILADLLGNPDLVDRFTAFLPTIDSLAFFSFRSKQGMTSLYEVIWRIGELQDIVSCIEGLSELLLGVKGALTSQGFRALLEEVLKVRENPVFQNLVKELPDLLSKVRACASITIGVNLDASLRPVQATLLSINDEPFTSQSLLNKLFGAAKGNVGIAPLHSVPQRVVQGHYAFPINPELGWGVEPMMVPLFSDLSKLLEKTSIPIANELKQYAEIHSGLLVGLRQSLIFYLGAVQFIRSLKEQGLPMCRPEIAPSSQRLCRVRESFNANLALRSAAITTNDIHIDPNGQILILTGPNRGGKTTYMVGVGIVQVLAQVGCFVPGKEAQISPVDNIFTHFPLEEKPDTEAGRLGEEAMRLGKIFERMTRSSLLLLNESLSTTSFGESLYLACDIVRILRRVGARAIYSTHLYELANRVDELNASIPGDSQIISLVSSPVDDTQTYRGDIERTFKIEVRPPLGKSYAREIASRYGISYEQLEKALSERGVL